jgi:N-acyl homoserine lactone hydrolase
MEIQIYPLVAGWLDNDIHTFDPAAETAALRAPALFWVVAVPGMTVVFDTGPSDPWLAQRRGRTNYWRSDEEEPSRQLGSIGLHPDDVDAVVLSHLHWDHASNWHLFRRARVYVQGSELAYAAAPEPEHRRYFDTVSDPPALLPDAAASAVNGSCLVLGHPQLQLIPLPGHSPGSQGLVIRTESARILLAGDTVPLLRNLVGRRPRANGIATDAAAARATIEQIPGLATDVLPSHDPVLANYSGRDIVPFLPELRKAWAFDQT